VEATTPTRTLLRKIRMSDLTRNASGLARIIAILADEADSDNTVLNSVLGLKRPIMTRTMDKIVTEEGSDRAFTVYMKAHLAFKALEFCERAAANVSEAATLREAEIIAEQSRSCLFDFATPEMAVASVEFAFKQVEEALRAAEKVAEGVWNERVEAEQAGFVG